MTPDPQKFSKRWDYASQLIVRETGNMAASTGSQSSTRNPAGMEGFSFPVSGRLPEDSAGKEQTAVGERPKKPCRACTDFKSWMKTQQKQTSAGSVQVKTPMIRHL